MEAPSAEYLRARHAETIIDCANPAGGIQPLAILNKANVDESGREENVRINLARDVIRFMDLPLFVKRGEPIAIVAGGPSLHRHLDQIRKFPNILAAGSTHDFLVENGITPSFAVACDAMQETADYYKNPTDHTSYLIASQCPPKLFDNLKDYKVALWNFLGQVDEKHYNGEKAIGWGCMVGLTSIPIAFHLGFQEFHFFGFDCCLEGDQTHAYRVSDDEENHIVEISGPVYVGPKQTKFISTHGFLLQVDEFFQIFKSHDGKYFKGYVYGDGLLAEVIKQSPPEMSRWLEAA